MFFRLAVLVWFALTDFNQALAENGYLRLVQIIFRHGDRAPKKLYPNDPNPESFWTDGLGNLTQIGRKQHAAIGKYLRSYYGKFITSDPKEVHFVSPLADQCLLSASSFGSAFYESELQKQDGNSTWHLPPIHALPVEKDKYLNHKCFCPRAKLQERKFFNSTEIKNFIQENMNKLRNMSACSGFDLTVDKRPITLWEAVKVERMYGLKIPDCVLANWNWLERYTDRLKFGHSDNPVTQRLRVGPYIGRVVDNMKKKIVGDTPHLKMYLAFSHATNVVAILQAMKLFDNHYPPYGAAIVFELHEGQNGGRTVRLLHMNSTAPEVRVYEPHVLRLDGCSEFCPLDYFISAVKFAIPTNWEEECKLEEPVVQVEAAHRSSSASLWSGLSFKILYFYIILKIYFFSAS